MVRPPLGFLPFVVAAGGRILVRPRAAADWQVVGQTMAWSIRERAEVLALLIENGFDVEQDTRTWALSLLDDPTNASAALDLLETQHPLDAVRVLREMPGSFDRVSAARGVLGWLGAFLKACPSSLDRVTVALEQMALRSELPNDLSGPCYGFDDARLLAEEGTYGSLVQVRADVVAFLEAEGEERRPTK